MNFSPNRQKKKEVILGSRTASLSLLGKKFRFELSRLRIPLESFDTHLYTVGKTKKGKSKFLEGLAYQLIQLGQGVCLIDPHGDLANNLLKLLAFHREQPNKPSWLEVPGNAEKLIYCHPGRKDYFVPMNILASDDEPYTITNNVVTAFKRTWHKELEAAPQFTNVAEHSILLLIEHGLSISELPRLIVNKEFRNHLVKNSKNQDIIEYFTSRFEQLGHREQIIRTESLSNKVTRLTLNPNLKLMLGSDTNALEFRQLMDSGAVVIFNLGYPCDRGTRDLLGSIIMARLEQAAFTRGELAEDKRRPFFCIVDEFQKFLNEGSKESLAEILSESRKFGLYLCLAHQGWHQLGSDKIEGALDQAQVKVVFGSGTQTAKVLTEEMHVSDPQKVKHQTANENSHPLYENLIEQKEQFKEKIIGLKRRQTLILTPESRNPLELRTMTVPNPRVTNEQIEPVKVKILAKTGMTVQNGLQQIHRKHNLHKQAFLNDRPHAGRVIQDASSNGRQGHVFNAENVI